MANAVKSIFDCDSVGAVDLPRRQLVTYDEDNLFSFGCDTSPDRDELANATKSLSIKVTIQNSGDDSHHKRKRYIDYDNDGGGGGGGSDKRNEAAKGIGYHEPKKKRISYVQSTTRDAAPVASTSRDAAPVASTSRAALAKPVEKRTKTTKSGNEPYELDIQIGEGTYGRVYKGHCTQTNTVIAIKRLTCILNTPNTDSQLDFIKREYENLMELQDCENVVHLHKGREHQLCKNELTIDFLFEYCPYDLKKLILNRRILFRLEEIKSFMRQMLLGLREIHSKSLMHRDFKTENILLTANGVVKIADFGLSRKLIDPLTTFERVKYTLEVVTQWYRAPEILLGERQYNERIDMWSMGCIMGEFWQRAAILQGENEIDQIRLISRLCGSMTRESWPNIVNLPVYQKLVELPKSVRQTRFFLRGKLPKVEGDQANHFFDKLMICNPDKRLSAEQALNDDFFYSEPLPVRNLASFMTRVRPFLRI